jgi:hypothetical protein
LADVFNLFEFRAIAIITLALSHFWSRCVSFRHGIAKKLTILNLTATCKMSDLSYLQGIAG